MAGGSQIIISKDGIQIITPQKFEVKAGQHLFRAGEPVLMPQRVLPTAISDYSNQFNYQIPRAVFTSNQVNTDQTDTDFNHTEITNDIYARQADGRNSMHAFVLDRKSGKLLAQQKLDASALIAAAEPSNQHATTVDRAATTLETQRFFTARPQAVLGLLTLSRQVRVLQSPTQAGGDDPLLEEALGLDDELSSSPSIHPSTTKEP